MLFIYIAIPVLKNGQKPGFVLLARDHTILFLAAALIKMFIDHVF